jgi:hypothetical protein
MQTWRTLWLFVRIVGRYDMAGVAHMGIKTAWEVSKTVHLEG